MRRTKKIEKIWMKKRDRKYKENTGFSWCTFEDLHVTKKGGVMADKAGMK